MGKGAASGVILSVWMNSRGIDGKSLGSVWLSPWKVCFGPPQGSPGRVSKRRRGFRSAVPQSAKKYPPT